MPGASGGNEGMSDGDVGETDVVVAAALLLEEEVEEEEEAAAAAAVARCCLCATVAALVAFSLSTMLARLLLRGRPCTPLAMGVC